MAERGLRVVAATDVFPLPADMGGAQRVAGLLRALVAAGHAVDLYALARRDGAGDADAARATLGLDAATVFPRNPPGGRLARRARVLVGAPPPWLAEEVSPALAAAVREAAQTADVVVTLDDYAGAYALSVPRGVPVVADKHHVMSAMAASGEPRPGLVGAVDSRLDPVLLRRFERRVAARARAVVVTSEDEAVRYVTAYGGAPYVVESGLDLPPRPSARRDPARVGWIGSLDHRSNVLGLRRFVAEALPLLPGVTLVVAGRGAADLTGVAGEPGVEVVGYVEDEPAFLDSVGAAVVPLWHGAGVKLKTLVFLAAGLPTATTRCGAEGVPVVDGVHAFVADSPAGLADGVRRALGPEGDAVAAAGRELVAGRYTWDVLGPRFASVVEAAAR